MSCLFGRPAFRPFRGLPSNQANIVVRFRPQLSVYAIRTWGICNNNNNDPDTESGQISQGTFSALSKPKFASKYAFESSRRDLQNALLCTVLDSNPKNQENHGAPSHRSLISTFSLIIEPFSNLNCCQNFAEFMLNFDQFFQDFPKMQRFAIDKVVYSRCLGTL